MSYFTTPTLSEVIENAPLESKTSIEILRLRYSSNDENINPELHERSVGDDILSKVVFDDPSGQSDLRNDPVACAVVQILFLSSIRKDRITTPSLRVTAKTLETLCTKLGVPLAFLDGVLKPSIWSKQSGTSFRRYDAEDKLERIDGFYHYFNEWDLGPLHTWFSYDIRSKASTYLLVDCPEDVKEKIQCHITDPRSRFLFEPLAVDLLIADQCASWRENFSQHHYEQIFDFQEQSGNTMDPPLRADVSTVGGLQRLHRLSRTWNMVFEDHGDLEERMELLIETAKKLDEAGIRHSKSTIEALEFIRARIHLRRRWVTSFGERTKLIINFVFGIAAENANQTNLRSADTNLEIAVLTSTIAEETQKDNSSMITIAHMTMLFLPGAFISSIFSMVFFNYGVNNDGQEVFQVSPLLWMFFAMTVPVTIIVFGIYLFWRHKREARFSKRKDLVEV